MKTYTEEEVRALIDENLNLIKESLKLQESLAEETDRRRKAEERYQSICERCIEFSVQEPRDMVSIDTITCKVKVPSFMSDYDAKTGLTMVIINTLLAKRGEQLLNSTESPFQ